MTSTYGKSIRIYLVDGSVSGIWTAEIINWTGKILVIPRSQLDKLAGRDDAKRTGIYFLVGSDPEISSKEVVYIGESDSVFNRLLQHQKDANKDFWDRAIIVISKDSNLTKAHVRYLESRMIYLSLEAKRSTVVNDKESPTNPLPEADISDMEFFLDQVKMILPVLGFSFIQPQPQVSVANTTTAINRSPIFLLSNAGTSAKGQEIDNEFVVVKGSKARKIGVGSLDTYKGVRERLIKEEKLKNEEHDSEFLIFAEDIAFSSPSAAATVVVARNMNGRTSWKTETGQSYQEWQDAKL